MTPIAWKTFFSIGLGIVTAGLVVPVILVAADLAGFHIGSTLGPVLIVATLAACIGGFAWLVWHQPHST